VDNLSRGALWTVGLLRRLTDRTCRPKQGSCSGQSQYPSQSMRDLQYWPCSIGDIFFDMTEPTRDLRVPDRNSPRREWFRDWEEAKSDCSAYRIRHSSRPGQLGLGLDSSKHQIESRCMGWLVMGRGNPGNRQWRNRAAVN
jgi:hypothetical protein